MSRGLYGEDSMLVKWDGALKEGEAGQSRVVLYLRLVLIVLAMAAWAAVHACHGAATLSMYGVAPLRIVAEAPHFAVRRQISGPSPQSTLIAWCGSDGFR